MLWICRSARGPEAVELSAWLRQQIAINGGIVHVRRHGAEEPIGAEELASELDRRLDGLTFHVRLIVDSRSPVEALGFVQSDISSGMESLQQMIPVESKALIEVRQARGRGRPSTAVSRVINEIMAGVRAGTWTMGDLDAAKQSYIEERFRCHHRTFKRALALIAGKRDSSNGI
jgi:hypothetical protein